MSLFFLSASSCFSQSVSNQSASNEFALKVINPPSGGRVVYGQIHGEKTESGAMGYILRSLHKEFDDRPQVSKLFQVKGTQSVALFFSLKNHFQKDTPLTGMAIVTKIATDHVEGAVIYDESSKFQKNMGALSKTLFAAWHPFEGVATTGGGPGAPIPQLTQHTLPDRSAAIGLPDGWQIASNMSTGGSIFAGGPNGESVEMGVAFLASDTNNPSVQQTMRVLQQGGLRNTMYARAMYYPYGTELSKTYVDLVQMVRQRANLHPSTFHFTEVSASQASGQQHCVRMSGQVDYNDGKGPRETHVVYCVSPPNRAGAWQSAAYSMTAPVAIAQKQLPTMSAIFGSFQVDMRVVNQEAAALAAPAIKEIQATGRAATERMNAAHRAEEIHNSSVYEHWDSMDRRSKEFENYQLGYATIHDIQENAHGTLWSQDADFLVQHDPQRYEYVSAPSFWKGIDY